MNMKDLLLGEMESCFISKKWFVSVLESLKDLTEEQAEWKNPLIDHSIKEIIIHLIFWNERYLKLFKNPEDKGVLLANDKTFKEEGLKKNSLHWNEVLLKFKRVCKEWIAELKKANEKKLDKEDRKRKWVTIISNISTHTAYHTGQIVILRKLQGSWNSSIGVK